MTDAVTDSYRLFLPPGVLVTWAQARKFIHSLRRQGWHTVPMPRGEEFVAVWCEGPGGFLGVSFWKEGVAVIELDDSDDIEMPPSGSIASSPMPRQ